MTATATQPFAVWDRLAGLMRTERARGGVLDVDTSTPTPWPELTAIVRENFAAAGIG